MFVFDGGVVGDDVISAIEVRDPEIGRWTFARPESLRAKMRDHVWRRLIAAVNAADASDTRYLERP